MKSIAVLLLFMSVARAAEPPVAPVLAKWELPKSAGNSSSLVWLPDGSNVVSGGEDGAVRVWAADGSLKSTLQPTKRNLPFLIRISSLAVSRDGSLIAVGQSQHGVRIWDRRTDRVTAVRSAAFFAYATPDDHRLAPPTILQVALVDETKTVVVSDSRGQLATMSLEGTIVGKAREMPLQFGKGETAFIRDEAAVALPTRLGLAYFEGHEVDELRLWDYSKNRLAGSATLRDLARPKILAISRDGRRALLRNERPGTPPELLVFDVASMKEVGSIVLPRILPPPNATIRGGFSDDGRLILVSQFDLPLMVHDAARLTPLACLAVGNVPCWSFSPDNRRIATGHADARVSIHDLRAAIDPNPPKALDAAACWHDLASIDAAIGMRAVWQFADHPAEAVTVIRGKLKSAAKPNADDVANWIKALDAPAFADRQAATKKLAAAADTIASDLEKAAKASASTETAQAIQTLIENAARSRRKLEGDALLAYRAVQVLESLGPPGIELLKAYAAGAPGAFLTEEARTALGRLQ